jgi:hypothetical protein
MAIPDQFRVDQFIREFEERWGKEGLPSLLTVILPNDHGADDRPDAGYPFRESYMADHDLALAHLGGVVTSYEIRPALSEAAARRLDALKVGNVELVAGDGLRASLAPASFLVIAVTGSLPTYPDYLEDLLSPGGRLFVVVGEEPAMTAMLVTRSEGGEIWRENLFETVLPRLENAPQPDRFDF